MKIRNGALYGLPLLLIGGIAFASYSGGNNPVYVRDALSAVSNKMSYSYGVSKCKAALNGDSQWEMACSSLLTPSTLTFTIQPADKAPYDVATSFYLTASNEPAKKASGEGLLSYLMINNG
ncbi:hypothetical protein [Rahnella sp. PCH160]|uniref:hypothetical protein n=1 Tax=Rahnella sp. PCH160 TaxID=3447928 RepID=UPI0039FC8449